MLMKKKKTREWGSGEFGNNPFKTLKRVQPAADSVQRKKITAPVNKEKTEDDTALFLRAVHGARSIDLASNIQPEELKERPAAQIRDDDGDEQQLFLRAMQRLGKTLRNEVPKADGDEPMRRSASSRMRQLKRGEIALSGELDLHGSTKDEALNRLEKFISEAYRQGQRAVLVITGKGINSAEGPVLKGAVAAWMREKGRRMVAEFAPAPRDKGGNGAFVVFLKSE